MNYHEADRRVDELVQKESFESAYTLLEKMRSEFPKHIYEITDYIVYVYLQWDRPTDAIGELMRALEHRHVGKTTLNEDCITIIYGEYEAEGGVHSVVEKLSERGVSCSVEIFPGIAHAYLADIVDRTGKILVD